METIILWYRSGGPLMLPLAFVAAAALLVLVERVAFVVRQSRVHARPFMERVIALVRADRVDDAIAVCAEHESALPDLGLVILRARNAEDPDLANVAEASTLTVLATLRRRSEWMPAIALTSILLGVLGGIMNLHDALMQVAQAAPASAGSSRAIAEAVAYALRPTGAGVLTAVPLVLGHAYVVSASQRLVMQAEEFSARLVNALADRPDVRLGHR
ncbi:MAG TPA: MotA/TolQ/ExbB proton channel family protein [Gemmatimonadaceae bacterium]|nr:MotA/TolQ/ExbB proton channel family protein [Gemmatimonadaceae bacterium]